MKRSSLTKILLLLNTVVTLHFTLNTFLNSSLLEKYLSLEDIGLVFTGASAVGLLLLIQGERFLVRYGELKTAVWFLAFDIAGLLGIIGLELSAFPESPVLLLFFFLLHYITSVYLLRFVLDVHYEEHMSNDNTGFVRGELLTTANIAWVLSPLIFSQLLDDGDYWKTYAASLLLGIIILALLVKHLPKEVRPLYKDAYFGEALRRMIADKDLYRVFMMSFLFHFLGSWVIIYLPLHLHGTIGMTWETIGFLFTLMLLPYVLIDIPLGYIADNILGEKEILIAGFIAVALLTAPLAFITTTSFLVWAILLSASRFGLAAIEIMTDSYFFKKVGAEDGNLIGLFRGAHPLAYIIGPLSSSILLSFEGFRLEYLFLVLGAIVLSGLVYALPLRDSR